MPKVRTTMQPLVELNVTEKEANDLRREGILLETTATTREALLADAAEQTASLPSPTGVDFDFTDSDDEDVVAPIDNRTTVGGNLPVDDDTDDEPVDGETDTKEQ